MKKYENFFDFFGLDEDANSKEIKIKTTKKVKSLHPDKSESDKIDKFESAKIARNVLVDEEERKKYKQMGHNKYVSENIDSEINGITFSGSSSLSQSKEGGLASNKPSSDDMEDLIEFRDNNRNNDPTITAVKQSDSKDNSSDDSAIKARKDWKEDDEDDKKDEAKKGMARLAVTILSIITSKLAKSAFVMLVLLSMYYIIYIIFGGLAVIFSILLSIGMFYVFATIF